ncbi:MAG TPA: hypothetical protein VN931_07345, partial [Fibrobacteria bacterium]|nr:hypothetical protein [Fibrobacteria bacterium]
MRKFLPIWLAVCAWEAHSQTINLRGLVTNQAGKPVANAIVTLQSNGLKDTSASDGSYSIALGASSSLSRSSPSMGGISMDGGALLVALDHPSSLQVELFDPAGDLLKRDLLPNAGGGTHRFSLATPSGKAALLFVRVSVDGRSTSFHCLSLGSGGSTLVGDGSARALAAVADTLLADAAGYAPGKLPISSYDQTANIVLDSVASVARSTGCDIAPTLNSGTLSIQSGGQSRKYILKVPTPYDKTQAYRLVFAFAESGSSAQSVADRNYFTMATYDAKNTIFAAPDAVNGAGTWSNTDVAFTDDILSQLEGGLCIDKTRIFATGFSFGAGMSMALACTRADVFRAVAFFSGADLTGSCPTTLTKPIAYYASQASQDANGLSTTSPITGEEKQAEFAAVNGCTAVPTATNFPASGQPHTCTIYKGCSPGHPTEYCVFNGPHGWQ